MSKNSVFHGARAILKINGQTVGVFSQCSYGVSYDNTPVYVLGRFSPTEIALTGQDPVAVSATGFRTVQDANNPGSQYFGPYAPGLTDNSLGSAINMPKLQDLIDNNDSVITIYDRQTQQAVLTVVGVQVVSFQTNITARGLQELSMNFIGIQGWDESGAQSESQGAIGENYN
jgi:hypothetical protein